MSEADEPVGIMVIVKRCERDLAAGVLAAVLPGRILRDVDAVDRRRCDAICPPVGISAGEQCFRPMGHNDPHEAIGGTSWPDHLTQRRLRDGGFVLSDVRAEREACAMIAETWPGDEGATGPGGIAAAIRHRSKSGA